MSRRSIALLAVLAFAGCGSDPQLSGATAGELSEGVEAVRLAAGDGDRDRALQALERLAGRVEAATADGELADADATALDRGIRRARRAIERDLAAAEPVPEATPPPEATPAPTAEPEQTAKPGKGPKPGKGGSKGDDDEGDD